jgi:phosphatidylglycerophosphate synthase
LAEIRQSYPPGKAQRDRLQNPYSYYVLAPLAFRLAAFFINQGVGPNTITLLGLLFVVCGLSLITAGKFFLGTVLLNFAVLLDNTDGHVARFGRQESLFGALFDDTVSWLHFSLLPICLGIGLFRFSPESLILPLALQPPPGGWLVIGGAKLFAYLFSIVLGERVELLMGEPEVLERMASQHWIVIAKGIRELESPLLSVAAVTGLVGVLFIGYACYQVSVLVYAVGRALRETARADRQEEH